MKRLIIILSLSIVFSSVSFAASIEQERMQAGITRDKEEQQEQINQQVKEYNKAVDEVKDSENNPVIKNVPEGYFICPKTGKLCPIKE